MPPLSLPSFPWKNPGIPRHHMVQPVPGLLSCPSSAHSIGHEYHRLTPPPGMEPFPLCDPTLRSPLPVPLWAASSASLLPIYPREPWSKFLILKESFWVFPTFHRGFVWNPHFTFCLQSLFIRISHKAMETGCWRKSLHLVFFSEPFPRLHFPFLSPYLPWSWSQTQSIKGFLLMVNFSVRFGRKP